MKQSTKRNKCHGVKSRRDALAKARAAKAAKKDSSASATANGISTSAPGPSSPVAIPQSGTTPSDIAVRESASKRKLGYCRSQDQPAATNLPLAVVDLSLIGQLFSKLRCETCQHNFKLTCSNRKGFVYKLQLRCDGCDDKEDLSVMTSNTLPDSKHYDVNRRMVAAFLNVGLGHAGLETVCETLGTEGMTARTHTAHTTAIHSATRDFSTHIMDEAVEKVKTAHGASSSDSILDIAVSFDGSWHKRGHTSKHGIGVIIEATTGLAVDFHVMSTYCHQCSSTGAAKKKEGKTTYETWYAAHQAECTINHNGSAGLMEVQAAKTMWLRSLDRGLRYTTVISDGDSKTFSALQELKPYKDVEIVKEECSNHVSKRLGTALRNLVQAETKRGNSLGGRKAGSLTQVKMNLLQRYYKKAVSSKCSSVEELRQKILMSFYHASSTDEQPQHQHCPPGKDSWCFWQRAVAFSHPPPSHKGKSSSFISPHVAKMVRPIYDRLTTDALLSRCLKGMTQNANESLHSVVWARCPKHIFVGRKRVEIATALGISEFNAGSQGLQQFLQQVGCIATKTTVAKGQKRDWSRIARAEKKETSEAKRRRRDITAARIAAQQEYIRQEDGPSYSAGAF